MQPIKRGAGWTAMAVLIALFSAPGVFAEDKLRISTVNYPLAYFAERISGDLAQVSFPALPDVDPAFWIPDAEAIAAYQAADVILLNGAGYAKWTEKVSLPRSRTVDTSRAFRDAYIQTSDGIVHSHGPGGEHSHGGVAFTTWLDLSQAAQQAEAVAQALTRSRPDARERIDGHLHALQHDLLELDGRIAEITRTDPGRPLLASHPVYQYLARRYRLNLRSVMWEPGEAPSENQWNELEEILREHPAKWMLWEGDPAEETVKRLQSLGIESLVFDPCGNRPSRGDFLTVMSENIRNLDRAFRQGKRINIL